MSTQQSIGRVAIIGGGSAAEQLCREIAGDAEVTVYEPSLVGGECPYLACMPSKAMLHAARSGASWAEAVAHRDEVTHGRDDRTHADELDELGVRLVRSAAHFVGPSKVGAIDGSIEEYDHVVIATGAEAVVPDVEGIDDDAVSDLVWTSDDLYRAVDRPDRVVVLGGGVIGFEAAELLAGLGSEVVVVERSERSFSQHPPEVSGIVTGALERRGVALLHGREAVSVRAASGGIGLRLDDGGDVVGDRLLVAAGRRPRTDRIGLHTIGLDGSKPLPVDDTGRVEADMSLWAVGDAAGRGEYTHLANHQSTVVADHLSGRGRRRFGDVAIAGSVFTDPPLIHVGESWDQVADDDDVVSIALDLGSFPRATTDRLPDGHLWVAARRSTGSVTGAAGAGPNFDELLHALVVAIDNDIPVARLRRSLRPFPTIGEMLGVAWDELHTQLAG